MYRMTIAAALAASLAVLTSAQAATPHLHRATAHHAAMTSLDAYAQAPGSRAPTVQDQDWDSRSQFYRGPTYVGRY